MFTSPDNALDTKSQNDATIELTPKCYSTMFCCIIHNNLGGYYH